MEKTVHIQFLIVLLSIAMGVSAQKTDVPKFPVKPEVLVEGVFKGCEGIAFNGEGRLFVTGDNGLWEITVNGEANKITDLYSNLGIAAIGKRDVLVADFGLTNAFRQEKNNDGIVWRITPEGKKTEFVKGIGDPNFILMMADKSLLISDDATNEIFLVDQEGKLRLFCTAVNHPNGLALSQDQHALYIAQIFKSIRPVIPDNRVWAVELDNGKPVSEAKLVTVTGDKGANDGLVMDKQGRVYIAANGDGKIWRFDPGTKENIIIIENIFGVASMVFGEGLFDSKSIYITTTYSGGRGGKVFRVGVGTEGLPVHR
ncbi:MAG: SMP-30/gluconolactonase/LRE family protein [Saonia sp.]